MFSPFLSLQFHSFSLESSNIPFSHLFSADDTASYHIAKIEPIKEYFHTRPSLRLPSYWHSFPFIVLLLSTTALSKASPCLLCQILLLPPPFSICSCIHTSTSSPPGNLLVSLNLKYIEYPIISNYLLSCHLGLRHYQHL